MQKNTVTTELSGTPAGVVVEPDFVVLDAIAVQHGPIADIAVDIDGRTLVATHYGDHSVSVIDAQSMTVNGTVAVAGEPFAATIADGRAYVSAATVSHDAIAVIDTETKRVIATHPLAERATSVAISHDGKRVFAGRTARNHVDLAVIDTITDEVEAIDIARGAGITVDAVRVSANGRRLYVATSDAHSGKLFVVDTDGARVITAIPTASPIRDIALSREGGAVYIASFDPHWGGAIDVVDTATNEVTAKVGIGGAPMQISLSPDGTRAYIVDYDHLAVLSTATNTVVDTISVGAEPSCMAMSPNGDRLYIADYAGNLTVLSVAPDTSALETEVITLKIMPAPALRELEPAAV
jgi:YVTN family beta-propeller protein